MPGALQGLIDNVDRDLTFAIEVESGVQRDSVGNYDEVRKTLFRGRLLFFLFFVQICRLYIPNRNPWKTWNLKTPSLANLTQLEVGVGGRCFSQARTYLFGRQKLGFRWVVGGRVVCQGELYRSLSELNVMVLAIGLGWRGTAPS